MNIKVYKILENTKVEGPGKRFCIWVQGCSKHCPDCYAKDTWDKNGGITLSTKEIIKKIDNQPTIEGVTFLGGEPFEQAKGLSIIAKHVQKSNKTVLTFTGLKYENLLKSDNYGIKQLLKYTDLLIDGEFKREQVDFSRPWVGSSNQRYIFLTDKYSAKEIKKYKNKIEIRLDKSGNVFMNGIGDFDKIIKQLSLKKI